MSMFDKLKKFFSSLAPSSSIKHHPRLQASARYGGMGERELQLRMEMLLDDSIEDTQRNVFATATALTAFGLTDQERFLQAIQRFNDSDHEIAYQFCCHGVKSLRLLSLEKWEDWLCTIEQQLRKKNRNAAIAYLKDVDQHLKKTNLPPHAVCLEDISMILEHIVTAFSGRQLSIEKAQEVYTDTEKIYLPENCVQFDNQKDNFALYKLQTVYQWAQSKFGTWDIYRGQTLKQHQRPDLALRLFQTLENIRLDACITRELPGMVQWLDRFGRQTDFLPADNSWQIAAKKLSQPQATAQNSIELVDSLTNTPIPETPLYRGTVKIDEVEKTINARITENKKSLQQELGAYLSSLKSSAKNSRKWSLEIKDKGIGDYEFELGYDDKSVEITPEIQALLASMMQDLGEVPQEYLQAEQKTETEDSYVRPPESSATTTVLPEWDYSINNYRQDWCHIFLHTGIEGDDYFIKQALAKHRHLVKRIKHTFEALRASDIRINNQPEGDQIDIDAAIQAIVDVNSGVSAQQNIYIKNRKENRDIAVMFMVDISGSTSGWVNQVEKEALILLCEAIEMIGDHYAIYGFFTHTRKKCNVFEIKSFDESYSQKVGRRIAGMQPAGYTRLGTAIRFLSDVLLNTEAQTRILITLSDGKPDDRDGYGGAYGIEDTRRAVLEARFRGIHPYCITIDTNAKDYLPYMYSGANFSIINKVEKLPFRIADIYRRITS